MFVLERNMALIFGASGDKKSLRNLENDLFVCFYVQPHWPFWLMQHELRPWFNANGKRQEMKVVCCIFENIVQFVHRMLKYFVKNVWCKNQCGPNCVIFGSSNEVANTYCNMSGQRRQKLMDLLLFSFFNFHRLSATVDHSKFWTLMTDQDPNVLLWNLFNQNPVDCLTRLICFFVFLFGSIQIQEI